jgi:hypothetical protein
MAIENEKQLEETQAWLAVMEKSLAELRQTVLPKNSALYEAMSKQFIYEIEKARSEIDEYLGMCQPEEAVH